jgi:hypothetical protein
MVKRKKEDGKADLKTSDKDLDLDIKEIGLKISI